MLIRFSQLVVMILSLAPLHLHAADSPRKVAVIFGGGRGSQETLDSQFGAQAMVMLDTLSARNYETRGAFYAQGFAAPSREIKPLSSDSFEQVVSGLEKELSEGKFKSGDQVVIQISNHGEPRKAGEYSHAMALPSLLVDEEGKPANAANYVRTKDQSISLDRLVPLLKKFDELGVKVGLLDLSCYSGNSLAFAAKNVCVMSASNRFSPATAGNREDDEGYFFWENAKKLGPNATLEQLFLKTRADKKPDYKSLDQMELSSPAHLRVRQIWDPLFAQQFAIGYNKEISREAAIAPIVECSQIGSTLSESTINYVNDLVQKTVQTELGVSTLRKYLDTFSAMAKDADFFFVRENTLFGIGPKSEYGGIGPLTFAECRSLYDKDGKPNDGGVPELEQELVKRKADTSGDDYDRMRRRDRVELLTRQIPYRKELLAACTNEKALAFMRENGVSMLAANNRAIAAFEKLEKISAKIGPKERELYKDLYSKFAKDTENDLNPCRDFRL